MALNSSLNTERVKFVELMKYVVDRCDMIDESTKKITAINSIGSILYIHGSGGNRCWPYYRVRLLKILKLSGFNVLSVGKYKNC